MMNVQVVVPLPLDQAYTYRVPAELEESAQVGHRVLAPFGRRRITAMITERGVASPEGRVDLKDILDVLDERPVMTADLLRLTRWVAGYYVCGHGEVVKAALPAGTTLASGPKEPRVRVKYETRMRFSGPFSEMDAEAITADLRGPKQAAVIEALARFTASGSATPTRREVMAQAKASTQTVQSLFDKGIIEYVEKETERSPLDNLPNPEKPSSVVYHSAQEKALASIRQSVKDGQGNTFLLHGVTGSGKTEVYIEALKRVLVRGKTGIILVPEIALTPQTVQRFRSHFPGQVAVLHSHMSGGERFDAWRRLRDGAFRIAIGPRSAVFAPLEDIGLIVVDEEHEASYKQFAPAPRYNARDVAVMRAHMNGAVCILGSATPSLESRMNCRWGKYTYLAMPERIPVPGHAAAPLPPVSVIDLTLERKKHRLEGALSEQLREAIHERLERAEQTILLQNRRGYAPVIECEDCGWSPECPDCAVTLTWHKASHRLRCHYCGRAERLPRECPDCGSDALEQLGTGTQRVEEEVVKCFPEARVLRMDRDTTTHRGAHHELLGRFGRGEADILLGTQMVAKGLDFNRVTLVGVVNTDTGLLLPDFRAEERTFQLLTQVAGRAGRADLRGEVLLQSRSPDHPVIEFALTHDYEGYAEYALAERKALGYPPFGRLTGVEFSGANERRVVNMAREWTEDIAPAEGLHILEPQPALINRIKNKYRYHTILKVTRSDVPLQRILREADRRYGPVSRGYRISIDVDAVGLF